MPSIVYLPLGFLSMAESQRVPLGNVASDIFGKKTLNKDGYMFESFYKSLRES